MADTGTITETLKLLAAKGLRYGTVIDLGCADAHFFIQHYALGLFAGAVPVNVDANPIYESSLKAIRDTLGGHYVIAAASDRGGEIELTLGSHPYWSSLLKENDPYWQRMNKLHRGPSKFPPSQWIRSCTSSRFSRRFSSSSTSRVPSLPCSRERARR